MLLFSIIPGHFKFYSRLCSTARYLWIIALITIKVSYDNTHSHWAEPNNSKQMIIVLTAMNNLQTANKLLLLTAMNNPWTANKWPGIKLYGNTVGNNLNNAEQ
jgi:hypothetical protein